jgi:nucleoside-diphosphate-sugar epimerase
MTEAMNEPGGEALNNTSDHVEVTDKVKILITGATGFVGQALCRCLVGRGFDVQILIRDPADFHKIPLELGAGMVVGSLENEASLAVACAGRNSIIHLAGVAHVGGLLAKQAMECNFIGTQNLLEAAIKANASRLVFLSSSLAQAAATGVGDVTAYGLSKLDAERLLQEAALAGQIDIAILRAVNVYGPGMKGNINRMISMIDKGRLPPLPEIKNQISLLSSHDLSQALLLALESAKPIENPITVSDGERYSVAEIELAIYHTLGRAKPRWRIPHMILYAASLLAGLVPKLAGGHGSISSRTYRNLVSDNWFANDRAKADLGFKPSTTFYQSLPAIIEAMREDTE